MAEIDRSTPKANVKKGATRRPINNKRQQKNNHSVIIAAVFIVGVILIAGISLLVKKYSPSKERVNLNSYYNVQNEEDMAIVVDNQRLEDVAKNWEGHVYLEYQTVHDYLNERFYWDANENILRYVTPTDVISVNAGEQSYMVTKSSENTDYTIVKVDADKMYIALDFVQKYTEYPAISYKVYEKPNRVAIESKGGTIKTTEVKRSTEIRQKGGIKSPIVVDVEKGATVTILESGNDWDKVCTQDGMIGYIRNNKLGSEQKTTVKAKGEQPVFNHLLKDKTISMGWHQVTNQDGNKKVANVLQSTKGINVLSPTWFYLNDNDGNIYSLANHDYVNYCHQQGVEVWALISNLENSEVDTTYVLTHTSVRDKLVNQIIASAIEYNLDGINLDFEALAGEVGDAYIQFIRELSIKCENNNIVLSVDNYVPSSYTAFYNRSEQALFADYIVIMAYDEHTRASEDVGSVASIGFVKKGVEDTLAEVPANQTILGMPFYTRVWELTAKDGAGEDVESASEDYLPYTFTCSEEGMQTVENRYTVNGAQPTWDDTTGQYYVEYENSGKTYKIWIENEASLEEKLKVMKDNSLAGAAYWKLGFERATAWDTIIKYVN
ncbi:MAG: glycosyl hydrolase family 18 [Clostridiales bacterium]|nr:glycosyl hydrolase family 18 [Clostridiales bacterium]